MSSDSAKPAPPIEDDEPATWQDLEIAVQRILSECGLVAERSHRIATARGHVRVDVWSEDQSISPPIVSIYECKHWTSPVPQTVVHAFRSVVGDSGANSGFIVSRSGFQAGAGVAAQYSNIRLVNWREFQLLHVQRWYRNFMVRLGSAGIDRLADYTEPLIPTAIMRKADALPSNARTEFKKLRAQYAHVVPMLPFFWFIETTDFGRGSPPSLPLRNVILDLGGEQVDVAGRLPDSITDATSLRGLLESVLLYAEVLTAEFDQIFGE